MALTNKVIIRNNNIIYLFPSQYECAKEFHMQTSGQVDLLKKNWAWMLSCWMPNEITCCLNHQTMKTNTFICQFSAKPSCCIWITNIYGHKRLLTKLSKNDLGKIRQGFKALTEDPVFINHPPPSHDLGSVILLWWFINWIRFSLFRKGKASFCMKTCVF